MRLFINIADIKRKDSLLNMKTKKCSLTPLKKIAFVIPYIGKLPTYFPFWLKTCANNPTVDFLLFTDDVTKYDYPPNVNVTICSFDELKERFQKLFDFPIALNSPYKFCDFRPVYGEAFAEELQGYDFLGHCDIDLFWGNIRNFLTEEVLNKYEYIYTHGHCCLYRNRPDVNSWYRTLPDNGYQKWREVFQNPKSRAFDEWGGHAGGGVAHIFTSNRKIPYNKVDFADLEVGSSNFCLVGRKDLADKKDLYFEINEKGVFLYDKNGLLEELIYVHFQKRNLKIKGLPADKFFLMPPNVVLNEKRSAFFSEQLSFTVKKFKSRIVGFFNKVKARLFHL